MGETGSGELDKARVKANSCMRSLDRRIVEHVTNVDHVCTRGQAALSHLRKTVWSAVAARCLYALEMYRNRKKGRIMLANRRREASALAKLASEVLGSPECSLEPVQVRMIKAKITEFEPMNKMTYAELSQVYEELECLLRMAGLKTEFEVELIEVREYTREFEDVSGLVDEAVGKFFDRFDDGFFFCLSQNKELYVRFCDLLTQKLLVDIYEADEGRELWEKIAGMRIIFDSNDVSL